MHYQMEHTEKIKTERAKWWSCFPLWFCTKKVNNSVPLTAYLFHTNCSTDARAHKGSSPTLPDHTSEPPEVWLPPLAAARQWERNRKPSTSCTWSKGFSTCWMALLCCQAACLQQDWQSHSPLGWWMQNANGSKISQLKYSAANKHTHTHTHPLPPSALSATSAFLDEPVNADRHGSSLRV